MKIGFGIYSRAVKSPFDDNLIPSKGLSTPREPEDVDIKMEMSRPAKLSRAQAHRQAAREYVTPVFSV